MVSKFELEHIRERKKWRESRFLGILENAMDECLKSGTPETMKLLYSLYISQRRWLWVYEQETRESMDRIVQDTNEARKKQKAAGKRMPKYPQHDWFEMLQLGVITAIDRINEDMKMCSCKSDKKRVAWVNFMFKDDFKKKVKK
jgi:hypothetical protein